SPTAIAATRCVRGSPTCVAGSGRPGRATGLPRPFCRSYGIGAPRRPDRRRHVRIGCSPLAGREGHQRPRMPTANSFKTRTELTVDGKTYDYFSLPALERAGFARIAKLPFSLKILLENLLRREDGRA